jgi:hypothetical protein
MNDNINRIRIINIHTGEVKETDATIAGINALLSVLDREIKSYKLNSLFEGRNIEEDIIFEGDYEYSQVLKRIFKQKLKKV